MAGCRVFVVLIAVISFLSLGGRAAAADISQATLYDLYNKVFAISEDPSAKIVLRRLTTPVGIRFLSREQAPYQEAQQRARSIFIKSIATVQNATALRVTELNDPTATGSIVYAFVNQERDIPSLLNLVLHQETQDHRDKIGTDLIARFRAPNAACLSHDTVLPDGTVTFSLFIIDFSRDPKLQCVLLSFFLSVRRAVI